MPTRLLPIHASTDGIDQREAARRRWLPVRHTFAVALALALALALAVCNLGEIRPARSWQKKQQKFRLLARSRDVLRFGQISPNFNRTICADGRIALDMENLSE